MEFRHYQPGDEEGILRLLKEVFQEDRSREWWQWYYRDNPAGSSIIYLAVKKGEIIGHRALVPYILWDGEGYKTVGQATDAVTHPAYQGQGIFRMLTQEAVQEAKKREWQFIFSFPNEKSLPGNQKMGWIPVMKLRKWIKPMLPFLRSDYNSKNEAGRLQREGEIGEEFTLHWDKYHASSPGELYKNADYIRWRYLAKPNNRYEVLTVKQQGELAAYLVISRQGPWGNLLEFRPGPLEAGKLLREAEEYLRAKGCKFVGTWPLAALAKKLLLLGYLPNPRRAGTFAVKPLTGDKFCPWWVSFGDTDYA
jgi:GNAT superfamily N-acetyltransferase